MSLQSIEAVPKYLAWRTAPQTHTARIDLSLNENRLGPSARAIEAYMAEGGSLWRYPDLSHAALKQGIAARFAVAPERIACAAGSNELIYLLVRLFARAGDEVLYPLHSFVTFRVAALCAGATPIAAPVNGFAPTIEGIVSSLTDKTKVVLLANPNNPTGAYVSRAWLEGLVQNIPANVFVIIDSAYSEYVLDPQYSAALELANQYANVIVLKTFSKIFGLAGLRIGWCSAEPAVADAVERLRGPYSLSGPALRAAQAALLDHEHTEAVRTHNAQWLPAIARSLEEARIAWLPGAGNFITCPFRDTRECSDFAAFLELRGILTRQLPDYDLPHCLRITVGTAEENVLLTEAIEAYSP